MLERNLGIPHSDKQESKVLLDSAFSFNLDLNNKIKEVCAPLEGFWGITLVAYRRFYLKGGLLYLFSNLDWMKYSFNNECWYSSSFLNRLKYLVGESSFYYLWPEKPDKGDKVYCELYEHDIWNGVIVYKKFADCIEAYAFASVDKKNVKAIYIYLFEKEVIERFILYFKDKLFPLVLPVQSQILIPYKLDFFSELPKKNYYDEYVKETDVKNFYIRHNSEDIKLTKRQEECLSLFVQHKGVKEIGGILGLSEKTVEFYLRKIVQKLKCQTKRQLIFLYKNHINHFSNINFNA